MHQHQAYPQAAQQRDVIDQVMKAVVLDGFATEKHDNGLALVCMDIGG